MANNFKDTNIYGNFTVKPLYATYSNIGVSSGNVTDPAYFTNSGNTDLNNLSVSGVLNCSDVNGNAKISLGALSGNNNITTTYSTECISKQL